MSAGKPETERFSIHSEHVRGERRYYWVWDAATGERIYGSFDRRAADKRCETLKRKVRHERGEA